MIQKMWNIKPIIGDDEPFITCFYRDVPNGFRFADIGDDFLTDYITDLELYFNDFEIVGNTLKSFKNLLKVTWNRKSEIVKKYANYDKSNIHYTYDTINNQHTYELYGSDSQRDSTDTSIDVPISDDDNTPSAINENVGHSSDSGNRTIDGTVTLDDGDIKKVNELTDNYRSVLDVLISVFKPCFVRFESYSY